MSADKPARNRLGEESSPYLLQHKDNPVHWRAWGADALAEAAETGKPILLSIGYSACHWCHVMAHESFTDPEIAGLMNQLYVNIKVDREERPDLDTIYQTTLALLGQQGGWPLTMFLTPKGEPFWGGTYFPPEPGYDRPGFSDVLRAVHATFAKEPDKIEHHRSALLDALGKLSRTTPGRRISASAIDQTAQHLLAQVDPRSGGIGDGPKFPQTSLFEVLWRAFLRRGEIPFRDAVLHTADRICQGGIYDHIGGGFARYSVDAHWLVPHFEKMLYDNALLLDLVGQLWKATRSPLFARRISETVAWTRREMTSPDGAFTAALDADSDGEEGKFYTWRESEIDAFLGPEADFFKQVYGVTVRGNWEGVNILNRSGPMGADASEDRLEPLRQTLLQARATRIRPGLDDKILSDWNGLMITALARVGAALDQPAWIASATRAFSFVTARLATDGVLNHSYCRGNLNPTPLLDDHANMARAALALFEATGEWRFLNQAEEWAAITERLFWDHADGGYFFTRDAASDLIVRTKSAHDAAVPPGNATMVEVLARLHAVTAKEAYRDRAAAVAATFGGDDPRALVAMPTLLNNLDLLDNATLVVVAGDAGAPETLALRRAVHENPALNLILAPALGEAQEGHPAAGKGTVAGKAAAYVCRAQTCTPPITEADELSATLTPSALGEQ